MREGVLAFFICWFIGFLMYLFIEAPVVNVLYTMFGLRRRIELTDQANKQSELQNSKKETIIKEESTLDENANIKEDCKSGYVIDSDLKCTANVGN